MDSIQAAILRVKLGHVQKWIKRRQQIARLYRESLGDAEELVLPGLPERGEHVFHLFVIRVRNREKIQAALREKGINTAVHYPTALPNLKAYSYLGHRPEQFPVASCFQDEILSLPMFPELSDEQVLRVSGCLRESLGGNGKPSAF